jgi:aconitate hydratase
LKKQGILPLTFLNESDYDKVNGESIISIEGVKELKPSSKLYLVVGDLRLPLVHTLNDTQIKWFKSGSALNAIKENQN